jgi:hypothetical protein
LLQSFEAALELAINHRRMILREPSSHPKRSSIGQGPLTRHPMSTERSRFGERAYFCGTVAFVSETWRSFSFRQ